MDNYEEDLMTCGYCGYEMEWLPICKSCGLTYCEYCGVERDELCDNCKLEEED